MYLQCNTETRSRIIVAVEKQTYYVFACVCARLQAFACVRVTAQVRGHVHAHECV
jgi:hypothetical protein